MNATQKAKAIKALKKQFGEQLQSIIRDASAKHNVSPNLIVNILRPEIEAMVKRADASNDSRKGALTEEGFTAEEAAEILMQEALSKAEKKN